MVQLDDDTRSIVAYHFCPVADEASFDEWVTLRFDSLQSLIKATDHKGRRIAHREILFQLKSWDG